LIENPLGRLLSTAVSGAAFLDERLASFAKGPDSQTRRRPVVAVHRRGRRAVKGNKNENNIAAT
jgi:hypothetical protein